MHFMGEEWEIFPAGGATGDAYVAQQGEQKIFIKRNSSPFLAVLSAEEIVPKLLWTKRLENGDVITAQKWVNGRELKSPEMQQTRVAKLLSKIHSSNELLHMFMRMGNNPLAPQDLFEGLLARLSMQNIKEPNIKLAVEWLRNNVHQISSENLVVCHGDVNHNNWIVSDGNLYLIDWDGAIVADPALDLAPLLYLYIPKSKWQDWLLEYGLVLTASLQSRLHWYMVAQCIESILWHWQRYESNEMLKWSEILNNLLQEKQFHSTQG
nr:phosphotransferase family protein [Evansella vedderi]